MGVTKAMTRHLAIFTTCPELGYVLPGLLSYRVTIDSMKERTEHNPGYARSNSE